MTSSASALPDDVDTLKAMVVAMISEKADLQDGTAELKAEIIRLATVNGCAETRIADLLAIIKRLERAQFGRSSEKLDADQRAFVFDEILTGLGAIEAELEASKPASERRATRPRKAFPAHLERVEIIIEPEAVSCGCGNCQPVRIGEDVSERLDVTPAKFRVIITRRPKYSCPRCKEGVTQAPAFGHLVDSGVPSEALLALLFGIPFAPKLHARISAEKAIAKEAARGVALIVMGVTQRPGDELFFGAKANSILVECAIPVVLVAGERTSRDDVEKESRRSGKPDTQDRRSAASDRGHGNAVARSGKARPAMPVRGVVAKVAEASRDNRK